MLEVRDLSKAFGGLKAAGYRHIALKQPLRSSLRKGAASVVPLADRVVGNLPTCDAVVDGVGEDASSSAGRPPRRFLRSHL